MSRQKGGNMSETTMQAGLPGLADDVPAEVTALTKLPDQVRYLLREYPNTRGDYKLLHFAYMQIFGRMQELFDVDAFRRFYMAQPDYRSVALRAQEAMKEDVELRPAREVTVRRQVQSITRKDGKAPKRRGRAR
jgi:hypothetical protein